MSKDLIRKAKEFQKEGNWLSYKKIVNQLIETNPENIIYYLWLRIAHNNLKERKESEKITLFYLEKVHRTSFNSIVKEIQSDIKKSIFRRIKSDYKYVDGANNYGALIHRYKGDFFFTKISPLTKNSKKEEFFYKSMLLPQNMILEKIAPKLISLRKINSIQYLTIEGLKPIVNKHLSAEIVSISNQIENIKLGQENKPEKTLHPKSRLNNAQHPVVISYFFKEIHLAATHNLIIDSLIQSACSEYYDNEDIHILKNIRDWIHKYKIHNQIIPSQSYKFQHGDFKSFNLGLDLKTQKIKVFDWANYGLGPRFMDILLFSVESLTPYALLKDLYLFNDALGAPLSTAERILALEAYILMHWVTFSYRSKENLLQLFIYPALKDFEDLIQKT